MQISEYINNTVWATIKPSNIDGVGVFAVRDIAKGTIISDYNLFNNDETKVFETTPEEFNKILPEIQYLIKQRMLFPSGNKTLIFCSPNSDINLQSFMNHSKTPNTDGKKAIRDIKNGEELTEDYTSFYPLSDINSISFI